MNDSVRQKKGSPVNGQLASAGAPSAAHLSSVALCWGPFLKSSRAHCSEVNILLLLFPPGPPALRPLRTEASGETELERDPG